MSTFPTAYETERDKPGRRKVEFLEIDLNACLLEFGAAPCTAGRIVDSDTLAGGGSSSVTLGTAASAVDDTYNGMWLVYEDPQHSGTVAAVNAAQTQITLAAGASAVDDAYNGMVLEINGEQRRIEDYVGATKVATVTVAFAATITATVDTYDVFDNVEAKISDYVGATKVATLASALSPAAAGTERYHVVDRAGLSNSADACYKTFRTCQDKTNFTRGVQTWRFCSRAAPLRALLGPAPEIRLEGSAVPSDIVGLPYLDNVQRIPTEVDPRKGLAARGNAIMNLSDDTLGGDGDATFDPYFSERQTSAAGTFWNRLLARNPHYALREARYKYGFVADPWDWDSFVTETYIIHELTGPDERGRVKVTLKDKTKLLDLRKIPIATDGALASDVVATANTGTAQAGAASTITLASDASAVDDAYNDMIVKITAGTGSGQERTISDYVGATKVATGSSAWTTPPDNTSVYEVVPVQFPLGTGEGAQYEEYVTTLGPSDPAYVRFDDEIVKISSRSGDTLIAAATTDRGVLNTTRADHDAGTRGQVCRVYSDTLDVVIQTMFNDGGLADSNLDLAGLTSEISTWFTGLTSTITDYCISEPTDANVVAARMLVQFLFIGFWDPIDAQEKFRHWGPVSPAASTASLNETQHFLENTVHVERRDKDRITRAVMFYARRNPTDGGKDPEDFTAATLYIDVDAESLDEFREVQQDEDYSASLGAANADAVAEVLARKVAYYRDAPVRLTFEVDPKDHTLSPGDPVRVTCRLLQDETGASRTLLARVLRAEPRENTVRYTVEISEGINRRFMFIAPDTAGTYSDDSEWGHIDNDDGSVGATQDAGYLII